MESDLLNVTSVDLSLASHDQDEASDVTGLHVLTADGISCINESNDSIDGTLASNDGRQPVMAVSSLSADLSNIIKEETEMTFNSSFIPENTILLETPRGLMLTVSDNISSLAYNDESSESPNDGNSRQLLSCIPVSLFGTCDSTVDNSSAYNTESPGSHLQVPSDVQDRLQAPTLTSPLPADVVGRISVDPSMPLPGDGTEMSTSKRKGGWPKGKKRKKSPLVTGPRAPLTGYVLYALDRRREIKENHPEISFPEVTRILGQEWSSMDMEVKEKYLAAAEADKKRYRDELKAFRSSDTYQQTVRKKIILMNEGTIPADQEDSELLSCADDEENCEELHCKVCDVYFSTLHNKQEHINGKAHSKAVAGAVEKQLLCQQSQEDQGGGLLDGALVVSEDTCTGEDFSLPTGLQPGSEADSGGSVTPGVPGSSSSSSIKASPVDIHGFMTEFINKNHEREQEISVLKKCLNKGLQENVTMCKEIQELQEYQVKLEDEVQSLTSTTSSLIAQNDALKMVPALFGINL